MEPDREQWELSKENIQPLRQGRKIAQLQAALNSDAAQHLLITEQQQNFESELRTYSGDDPLDIWYRYIQWVEQHYPKGGKDGNLLLLVRQCCLTFQKDERYTNDPRFLQVWLKLVDVTIEPLEIFNFVFMNNLCCNLAELYIRWADELEKVGNFARANDIIEEGLNRKAQPFEDLQAYYRKFIARAVQIRPDQDNASGVESQRMALSALKTQGKKNRVPNNRLEAQIAVTPSMPQLGRTHPVVGQLQKTPSFSIFQENATPKLLPIRTNDETPLSLPHSGADENVQNPGKWSKAKVRQKHVPVVPLSSLESHRPAFVVHEDPLQPPAITPRRIPDMCGPLSEKKLPKAPAMFLPCSSESNPLMKPMYCKDKIYRGGQETSFEEIRAARYIKKQNEKKKMEEAVAQQVKLAVEQLWQQMLQQGVQPFTSAQNTSDSVDFSRFTSIDLPPTMQGIVNSSKIVESPNVQVATRSEENSLAMNNSAGSCNQSHTARAPSPTVHTKEAIQATMALFNQSIRFSVDNFTETTESVQVANGGLPQVTSMPFTIFSDACPNGADTEKDGNKEKEVGEDKENEQPPTYSQQHCNRELAGILQPSTNILFVPLEEQDQVDDEKEFLDGVAPLSESKYEDYTFVQPRNSSAFAPVPKYASTPMSPPLRPSTELEQHNFRYNHPPPEQTFFQDSSNQPTKGQEFSKTDTGLSVIREMSDEASGSSMAAPSTLQHSLGQSAQNENIAELFEKLDMNDLNPFCPQVREWTMKTWALKHTTADIKNVTFLQTKMPWLRAGASVALRDNYRYHIYNKIGEGAYAKIFRAMPESNQEHDRNRSSVNPEAVLKVEQPSCLWEYYISAALEERLHKQDIYLDEMGGIIQFNHAYIYSDGSILVTDLWKSGTLLDVINTYKKKNTTLPESIVMFFTIELLHILHCVHRCNIIHADIKPDNILLKQLPNIKPTQRTVEEVFCNTASSLLLIDLGRSIDMDAFPSGSTFHRKIETEDFVCTEMLDSRPWTYQVDYYGLLATVHCMLFGTYMKVSKVNGVWKLKGVFKRYWQTNLWQAFFHELLNVPNCQELPDLQAWRLKFQNTFVASEGYKTFAHKVFQLFQWCSMKGY